MNITLRYFASIREALGTGSQTWQTQASTVAALRDELMAQGGAYAALYKVAAQSPDNQFAETPTL